MGLPGMLFLCVVNQNRSPQVHASWAVSCRFCWKLATIAARMIPLEQPNIAHTHPGEPPPNTCPGVGGGPPAYATVDENAKEAASTAARIFDFPIAHLIPNQIPGAVCNTIIHFSMPIYFCNRKSREKRKMVPRVAFKPQALSRSEPRCIGVPSHLPEKSTTAAG